MYLPSYLALQLCATAFTGFFTTLWQCELGNHRKVSSSLCAVLPWGSPPAKGAICSLCCWWSPVCGNIRHLQIVRLHQHFLNHKSWGKKKKKKKIRNFENNFITSISPPPFLQMLLWILMSQQCLTDVMAVPACRSGLWSRYFLLWWSPLLLEFTDKLSSDMALNVTLPLKKMDNVFNKQHVRFER